MIRKPRGGAMLASLIVIGVIALLTVATLQLANISKQQAAKDARSLSQVACVEAARQYVLSRLRLFGAPATSITLDQAIVVGTGSTGFLSGRSPQKQMRTGHVTEYPLPQSENTMREFFTDLKGRMWFGSPANNKVGYFTLASQLPHS